MATGRYKLGPDGTYFDPLDSGPDQASPDQIQQYQQQQSASAPAAPAPPDASGGYQPPTGGISGGGYTGLGGDTITPTGPEWQQSSLPVMYYAGGSQTFNEASPTGQYPIAFDPSKASPTTGINGGGGAQQAQGLTANQPGQSGPWNGAGVPAGFDANKWNDPTKNDPKYDIGHMVAGGWTNDSIANYMAQHPQEFQGFNITGKDTITDGQGNVFDFRNGLSADPKGLGTAQWTQVGGPGGGGGAGGAGVAGASGAIGAGAGTAQGVGGAPSNSAFSDQVRQLLLQQIGSATNPVTGEDPAIKAEMDAQTAGADRLRREQRASQAERAAMNGLLNGGQSSGSFEQDVNNDFSNEQQQLAGVRADLFTREIQSRRQYAQGLLNQAMQSGDAESARQLQAYLAQLDNAYRYAALAQNQGQFNDQFGLQAGQFQYQKDRDLAQYGAGY